MRKKNKISKVLVLLMLIASMLGTCYVSAGAATVPYRTVQRSDVPVKVGNSYVWDEGEPGYGRFFVKKSKSSPAKPIQWETWGTLGGVTDGKEIFCGEQLTSDTYGALILRKYSIATGKVTKYKTLEGVYGGTVSGYYKNKLYYCYLDSYSWRFRAFDIKTRKDSLVNKSFDTYFSYGKYILGRLGAEGLKVYNMETKKFVTLSQKGYWGGSGRAYGDYYYYPKYIAKASGKMKKYKIYKFNLKTGKSSPVSKIFEASDINEITNKKVTYYKNTQDGEKIKEYTLKY